MKTFNNSVLVVLLASLGGCGALEGTVPCESDETCPSFFPVCVGTAEGEPGVCMASGAEPGFDSGSSAGDGEATDGGADGGSPRDAGDGEATDGGADGGSPRADGGIDGDPADAGQGEGLDGGFQTDAGLDDDGGTADGGEMDAGMEVPLGDIDFDPADGATHVMVDEVVLTFPSSMNEASVEAALGVDGATLTTVDWDGSSTVATLRLTMPFANATPTVTVTVGEGVITAFGEDLASPQSATFTLAPLHTQTVRLNLGRNKAASGTVGTWLVFGDTPNNTLLYGGQSFKVGGLPAWAAKGVSLRAAELQMTVHQLAGDIATSGRSLTVQAHDWSAGSNNLDNDALAGVTLATVPLDGLVEGERFGADLTAGFRTYWEAEDAPETFLTRLLTSSDQDGAADTLRLKRWDDADNGTSALADDEGCLLEVSYFCATDCAPEVVSLTPEADATEVQQHTLRVSFSEPMDTAAVADATSVTVDGAAHSPLLTWSEGDRTLTIDLGEDIFGVVDLPVTVTIGTAATDVAGVPLEDPLSATFTLASMARVEIDLDLARNLIDGGTQAYSFLQLGDSNTNVRYFAGQRFDVSALPALASTAGLHRAWIEMTVHELVGAPGASGLVMSVEEHDWSATALDLDDDTKVVRHLIDVSLDQIAVDDRMTLDITGGFQDWWEATPTPATFHTRLSMPSDNDNVADQVRFRRYNVNGSGDPAMADSTRCLLVVEYFD